MHNESGFCFLTFRLPAAMRWAGVAAISLFFLSGCVTTGDSAPKTSATAPTTGPAGKGASEEYVKLLLAHGSRAHAAGDHDEVLLDDVQLTAAPDNNHDGIADTVLLEKRNQLLHLTDLYPLGRLYDGFQAGIRLTNMGDRVNLQPFFPGRL